MLDTLHRALHRLPGFPAHSTRKAGHPAGHQGAPNRRRQHRPPRFLPAWQHRIAALLGRAR